MKKFKWFFLSMFVLFADSVGFFIAFDCDFYGVHEWHDKLAYLGAVVAFIGVSSILTMGFQLFKILYPTIPKIILAYYLTGWLVISVLVVLYVISWNLCH